MSEEIINKRIIKFLNNLDIAILTATYLSIFIVISINKLMFILNLI